MVIWLEQLGQCGFCPLVSGAECIHTVTLPVLNVTEYDILNCNAIIVEAEIAKDVLKNDNPVGIDMIVVELLI